MQKARSLSGAEAPTHMVCIFVVGEQPEIENPKLMDTFTTLRGVIISVLGLSLCWQIIATIDHWYFLDSIFLFALATVSFIAYVFIVFKDYKTFKKDRQPVSFIPTALGLIFVGGIALISYGLSQQDRGCVIIYGSTACDPCCSSIEFRDNGTYKLGEYCLGAADYYRGNYRMYDSIIILDHHKIADTNLIESKRLKVRLPDSMIVQIDSADREIPNSIVFDMRRETGSL